MTTAKLHLVTSGDFSPIKQGSFRPGFISPSLTAPPSSHTGFPFPTTSSSQHSNTPFQRSNLQPSPANQAKIIHSTRSPFPQTSSS
ncbi:hypothetical protein PGTUg99_006987 [Puccinia graminis f. sp. tritici]|uniref:Uncharacterized protein n=1 Tax=Puccinia graminis f. sp. tritici TaxID=56615 RepID=A0A5B0RBA6_PUCGR|nr:hypothetical protein PGTUg99_006987 [Puccinia graminis f. sp. tritici]